MKRIVLAVAILLLSLALSFAQLALVNNGDSGLVARNKINAGLSAINAGGLFSVLLTANSVVTTVAPYTTLHPVSAGGGNFGPSAGETSLEFIDVGQLYRIRQSGLITQIKIYIPSLTGVNGFFFKVWRGNGTTYDLIGTSSNLFSGLIAGQINTITLPTGILAQEGDYVGAKLLYTAASVQNLFATTVPNSDTGPVGNTIYSVTNSTPASVGFDWASQTATAGVSVLIEVGMSLAPVIVNLGDSITSGFADTSSFIDNHYGNLAVLVDSYPFVLGHMFGYTYQNMGISGNTTTQMAARFTTDVLNLNPRVVVIMGGINDIVSGSTNAVILANFTTMLNAAVAAGIRPIVTSVMPARNGAGITNAMMQQRDLLNSSLHTLVTSAPYNGSFVNLDSSMGTFFPGGDPGNLWALQASYDSGDGVHPNPNGDAIIAGNVAITINQINLSGVLNIGSLSLNNNISLNGQSPQFIQMGRNPISTQLYPPAAIHNGNDLNISAGGATPGAQDAHGGDLILQPGTSTGSGYAHILFMTNLISASGRNDITNGNITASAFNGKFGIGIAEPAWPFQVENPTSIAALIHGTLIAQSNSGANSVAIRLDDSNAGGHSWTFGPISGVGSIDFRDITAPGAPIILTLNSSGITALTNVNSTGGFSSSGNAGLSVTKTVRAAGGAADCTLIFTGGLLTGGTC